MMRKSALCGLFSAANSFESMAIRMTLARAALQTRDVSRPFELSSSWAMRGRSAGALIWKSAVHGICLTTEGKMCP